MLEDTVEAGLYVFKSRIKRRRKSFAVAQSLFADDFDECAFELPLKWKSCLKPLGHTPLVDPIGCEAFPRARVVLWV